MCLAVFVISLVCHDANNSPVEARVVPAMPERGSDGARDMFTAAVYEHVLSLWSFLPGRSVVSSNLEVYHEQVRIAHSKVNIYCQAVREREIESERAREIDR